MKPEVVSVSGRECYLYVQPEAKYLLIQPVDEHDLGLLEKEVKLIQELSSEPFSLAAFKVNDWNRELTPWPAPPVFGKEPFGDGAEETLGFIIGQMIPKLQEKAFDAPHRLLGGYSLAGLFSLWVSYQTDKFEGIAAVSPSVWFPKWLGYAQANNPQVRSIYLSLGDKRGFRI